MKINFEKLNKDISDAMNMKLRVVGLQEIHDDFLLLWGFKYPPNGDVYELPVCPSFVPDLTPDLEKKAAIGIVEVYKEHLKKYII